jgi:hypothetical protein
MNVFLILMTVYTAFGPEDAARLSASDLPAYRAALENADRGEAPRVDFRTLWNDDQTYRNRRVSLEGRIVRRFSQPPVGEFPALTEFWVVNDLGEPICVVVPTSMTVSQDIRSNSRVLFRGTYLRPIRYQAVEGDRIAPLVVASNGPRVVTPAREGSSHFWGEVWIAAALAVLVAAVLLVQFLRKPARRVWNPGESPTFLKPGEEESSHGEET